MKVCYIDRQEALKWPKFPSRTRPRFSSRPPPCRRPSRAPSPPGSSGAWARDFILRTAAKDAASLIRRHLWEVAAGFFPGGLVADRTALEHQPAPDGSVFLVASRGGKVALPGVTLRARRGLGPLPDDFNLRDDLYCMSTARALIENMRPTRARSGAAPTLKRSEIETWLERFLRNSGKERLNALRDQIKTLAPTLKMEKAGARTRRNDRRPARYAARQIVGAGRESEGARGRRSIRSASRCLKSCTTPCGDSRPSPRVFGTPPAARQSIRLSSRRISPISSKERNSRSRRRARSSSTA